MAYSECLPTRLNPLAERTCFSQVRLQLESTLNVHASPFNDWFTGHLNYQIEHHLAPTMPRHNYHILRPRIEALCKAHGMGHLYQSKTMLGAMGDIVESLRESGEMWLDAYHLEEGSRGVVPKPSQQLE